MLKYHLLQLAALIDSKDIGFDGPTSADGALKNILNGVYFWAGAVAIIVIVIAGFLYTTSNGDSAQLTRAKNAILGACIGLVVVIFAFGITNFVLGAF